MKNKQYIVAIPNLRIMFVKASSKRDAKRKVRTFLGLHKLPAGTKIDEIGK